MSVRFIEGFESQGLQAWTNTSGTPTVQNSVVHTGDRALQLGSNDSCNVVWGTFLDNDYGVGAWVRFSSLAPSVSCTVMAIYDQPTTTISVFLDTNGDLGVTWVGDGGTPTTISSPPISANTWHFFELYFYVSPTIGTWEFFIDGTSVASQTGTNMSVTDFPDLLGLGGNQSHGINIYFDDIYIESNLNDVSERYGDCRILAYRSNLASATGDYGSALTAGTWANVQQLPFSDTTGGDYDTSSAISGSVSTNDTFGTTNAGPTGDSNVPAGATFKAQGYLIRAYRGGGSPAEHYLTYGSTSSQSFSSGDLALGTSVANYTRYYSAVTAPAGSYDWANSYMRVGFGKTSGARGFFCYDLLGFLAFVPPPISSLLPPSPMKTFMPFLAR